MSEEKYKKKIKAVIFLVLFSAVILMVRKDLIVSSSGQTVDYPYQEEISIYVLDSGYVWLDFMISGILEPVPITTFILEESFLGIAFLRYSFLYAAVGKGTQKPRPRTGETHIPSYRGFLSAPRRPSLVFLLPACDASGKKENQ